MAVGTFNVLDALLYLGLRLGPPWLDPGKILKIKGSQKVGKHSFEIGFGKFQKRAVLLFF